VTKSRLNPILMETGKTDSQLRLFLQRLGFVLADDSPTLTAIVVEGVSASSGVVALPLAIGGGSALAIGSVGVPVSDTMVTACLSVAWLSDNAPGDWTLRLLKRTPTSDFTEVATFTASTS